jgi:RimJ/RimL family protein N-acetyltransferase
VPKPSPSKGSSNISFRKASKKDKELIIGWFKKPHLKGYWDNAEEIHEQFNLFLSGKKAHYEYWICSCDKEPFALILTADASEPEHNHKQAPDYIVPWLEPEGQTLLIDFAICEKSFLGKGLSETTLKQFAQMQEPHVTAFLAAPEVKNEQGIHVYEQAGFARVGTFIRGQGFFKGKPHYLLKMKISRF